MTREGRPSCCALRSRRKTRLLNHTCSCPKTSTRTCRRTLGTAEYHLSKFSNLQSSFATSGAFSHSPSCAPCCSLGPDKAVGSPARRVYCLRCPPMRVSNKMKKEKSKTCYIMLPTYASYIQRASPSCTCSACSLRIGLNNNNADRSRPRQPPRCGCTSSPSSHPPAEGSASTATTTSFRCKAASTQQ